MTEDQDGGKIIQIKAFHLSIQNNSSTVTFLSVGKFIPFTIFHQNILKFKINIKQNILQQIIINIIKLTAVIETKQNRNTKKKKMMITN